MKTVVLSVLIIIALIAFHFISLLYWIDYRLFVHYSLEVLSVSLYGLLLVFNTLAGLVTLGLSVYFVYANFSDMIQTKAKFSWGWIGASILALSFSMVFLSQVLDIARDGSMKIAEIGAEYNY